MLAQGPTRVPPGRCDPSRYAANFVVECRSQRHSTTKFVLSGPDAAARVAEQRAVPLPSPAAVIVRKHRAHSVAR